MQFLDAVDHWIQNQPDGRGLNTAELHDWLVAEHDYPGSRRSVQRFVSDTYPAPARRARRRVETPPGAQAQADGATFLHVVIGERETRP